MGHTLYAKKGSEQNLTNQRTIADKFYRTLMWETSRSATSLEIRLPPIPRFLTITKPWYKNIRLHATKTQKCHWHTQTVLALYSRAWLDRAGPSWRHARLGSRFYQPQRERRHQPFSVQKSFRKRISSAVLRSKFTTTMLNMALYRWLRRHDCGTRNFSRIPSHGQLSMQREQQSTPAIIPTGEYRTEQFTAFRWLSH